MREKVILVCTECLSRNYSVYKNNRTNVKRPFRLLTPERAFYIAVICEKRRMSKGQQAVRSLRPASSM